ncbi:MAG: DUF4912 domain-containing protein [Chthoniobacterales bacterium]
MSFELEPNFENAPASNGESADFSVSSKPVVTPRSAAPRDPNEIPRSYGAEALWLVARDPESLFAYWDIDWMRAFGEEHPRPREVHFRLLDVNGLECVSIVVEPMAAFSQVRVPEADAAYRGEIGYFDSEQAWRSVARSEEIYMPRQAEATKRDSEFATVPMHLSFQAMIDASRRSVAEQSLTDTLAELRARSEKTAPNESLNESERALAEVIKEAAGRTRPSSPARDLWAQHRLEQVSGFGNSSLSGGFGGSSRAR